MKKKHFEQIEMYVLFCRLLDVPFLLFTFRIPFYSTRLHAAIIATPTTFYYSVLEGSYRVLRNMTVLYSGFLYSTHAFSPV